MKDAALTIGHRCSFDLISHFNEKRQMGPISDGLCNVILFAESYINYCSSRREPHLLLNFIKRHYLEDGCKNLFDLMFACNDQPTRMHIAKITAKIINKCFVIYGVCSEQEARENPGKENTRLMELYKALDEVMGFIFRKLTDRECHKNWSRLQNYFTLLMEIVQGGKY
jgi:hypothetical protein